jgi:hypothetical protein
MDEVFIFREFQTNHALSVEGKVEKVFHLPEDSPDDSANTNPDGGGAGPTLSTVEEAHAARASKVKTSAKNEMHAAQRDWMEKIKRGDTSGVATPDSAFIPLPGRQDQTRKNPRTSAAYKQACLESVGLGKVVDPDRYGHLEEHDYPMLQEVVARGSSCMWLPDSDRTMAIGFMHRLITKGPPVRVPLHRLSRPDQEWIEKAIQENVERGQLKKGASQWGAPAFPTKASAAHKSTQKDRRMVIDYRGLNRVTVRRFSSSRTVTP